jgi:MFS family permease
MVQALLSPVCGMLIDRWGPRLVVVSGLLSMAVGLAACRMVQELWHLTVLFGVLVGLGVGLAGQVTHVALLSVWFRKRRGSIIGFAFAGMGLGVQAISPLAQHLIVLVGWRQTFEGVPPFTRGVMGHEIGLALARELRPLVPGHSLPLSSPQRIQWHVCGGRRGQDGCDRADAV